MSIYRFSSASPLQEVLFRYAKGRQTVALLVASENTSPEKLAEIRRMLESQGRQCVPAFAEGREVLQVSGFANEEMLIKFLRHRHFIQDEPAQVTAEEGDHPKLTFRERLQSVSLKIAGAFNLVGDAGFLLAGLRKYFSGSTTDDKREGTKNIILGSLYTAGGLNWTFFGNPKKEYYLRQVSERTAEFIRQRNGTVPEDTELSNILKNRRGGIWSSTRAMLHKYTSEITLGAYLSGAVSALYTNARDFNTSKKAKWMTLYGAYATAVKGGSMLIREKSRNEEEPPEKRITREKRGPVGSFINWIKEKPMRLFGYGSMVSEVILGAVAYAEYKDNPKQKSFLWTAVSTGSYILSDFFAGISNKNHTNADGKFTPEEQRRIEAMVAEALARQPEQVRDGIANEVGAFLAKQGEIKGRQEEISASICEQTKRMKNNRWAARVSSTPELAAAPAR